MFIPAGPHVVLDTERRGGRMEGGLEHSDAGGYDCVVFGRPGGVFELVVINQHLRSSCQPVRSTFDRCDMLYVVLQQE